MDQYDVVVVGAGPAGSSAALAARRSGASVLLLDRSDFPRDKPCGDGIAAQALDVLAGLGVPDPTVGFRPVEALRLVAPGGRQVARRLPRPAYTVPRRVFDARLVAAAVAAGAVFRRHVVRRVEPRDDLVVLDRAIAGRTVVGADGAGSVVRRALGFAANPDGHLALAIRGYAPAPPSPDEQWIVTTAEHWPAYAWSFPIGWLGPAGRDPWPGPAGRDPWPGPVGRDPGPVGRDAWPGPAVGRIGANVGYGEVLRGQPLTRAHLSERLAALLPQVAAVEVTDLRAHHLPLSTRRPPAGRGPILLAGDALSLINPFTGEGIFYAVLSGALAGAAAAGQPRWAADRYRLALRRRLGTHLRHSSLAARLGRRRSMVDAAVRAAERDERVFATMVDVGLGDGRLDARTLRKIAVALPTGRSAVDRPRGSRGR